MFNVTEAARARLFELLADDPNDVAVRLVRRRGHSRLRRGNARPGDTVFEFDGRTVLLLKEGFAEKLRNRTLSLQETEKGPRLRLRRTSRSR